MRTVRRAHPRVSVNSICSIQQSLDDDVAMWQELGIDHVGLILHKVEAAGWDHAARLVRAAGLRVSTLAGPVPVPLTVPAGSQERRDEQAMVERGLEFGAAVGAGSMYLCSGNADGLSWDAAADAFCAAVAPSVARAEEMGVPLAVEPTNPLRADVSFLFTFRDAVDLARAAGIGVVADLQSCWYERGFPVAFRDNLDVIALVQVSDFVVGTLDTPNRAVPGDGTVPIAALLEMTLAAGYQGPFDVEILGPRIEAEGYPGAIARSVTSVSGMLDDLGA